MRNILCLILFGWSLALYQKFSKSRKTGKSGRRRSLLVNQYSKKANKELSRKNEPLQYFFFTYLDLFLAIIALASGLALWFLPLKLS